MANSRRLKSSGKKKFYSYESPEMTEADLNLSESDDELLQDELTAPAKFKGKKKKFALPKKKSMAEDDELEDEELGMAEDDELEDEELGMAEDDELEDEELGMAEDDELEDDIAMCGKYEEEDDDEALDTLKMQFKNARKAFRMAAEEEKPALIEEIKSLKARIAELEQNKNSAAVMSEMGFSKKEIRKIIFADSEKAEEPKEKKEEPEKITNAEGFPDSSKIDQILQGINSLTKAVEKLVAGRTSIKEELEAPADFSENKSMKKKLRFSSLKTKTANTVLMNRLTKLERQQKQADCIKVAKTALKGYMDDQSIEKEAKLYFSEFGPKGIKHFIRTVRSTGVPDPDDLHDFDFEKKDSETVLQFSDKGPEVLMKARMLSNHYQELKAHNHNQLYSEKEFIEANLI